MFFHGMNLISLNFLFTKDQYIFKVLSWLSQGWKILSISFPCS
jgi:hypothetical protein